MNPVYEDINMKIKLWEEENIPCYLTEKEEEKNLMPSSRIVFEIADLTHYKKNCCEFCVAGAILL